MEENTTPAQAATEQPNTTQAPAVNEGKTLTQEEVNAVIAKRLERERKQWEKDYQARLEEERKQAEMTEAEKHKAETAKERAAREAAEARATRAERKAALAGKVADAEAALRLLDDAHLDTEGNVNVDALLKAYPFLAPQTQPVSTLPGAPSGGTARGLDLEKAIASGDTAAINAALDAALKR